MLNNTHILCMLMLLGFTTHAIATAKTTDTVITDKVSLHNSSTQKSTSATGCESDIYDSASQPADARKAVENIKNYRTIQQQGNVIMLTLNNGEVLTVIRGGCAHYSFNSALQLKAGNTITDTKTVLKKAIWLLKNTFIQADYEMFTQKLKHKQFKVIPLEQGYIISLPSKLYCGMQILAQQTDNKAFVEVGYYMC